MASKRSLFKVTVFYEHKWDDYWKNEQSTFRILAIDDLNARQKAVLKWEAETEDEKVRLLYCEIEYISRIDG